MSFDDLLGKRIIYFDGAMGTQIQNLSVAAPTIPETLNITHPELITEIHKDYISAGSDIISANTFGANRYKLSNSSYTVKEIISAGISCAKKAGSKFTALDIGPIGTLIGPLGDLTFEEAYNIFAEQVSAGSNAGCDLILIETMTDIYEAKAAILAAKELCNLPIICSMTFEENGRTLTGTDPQTMVTILEGLDVDIIGINCSFGPDKMLPLVKQICKYSSTPVLVQPNAGLPIVKNNKTIYNTSPKQFSKYMKEIADSGAWLLGGCCGTSPEYVKDLVKETQNTILKSIEGKNFTAVCSSTKTVIIGSEVKIIGERINPTGKKKLKEALRNNNIQYITDLAISQSNEGAHILDVNVGLPEINEIEMMSKCIEKIQQVVDLPIQIDSTKPDVIESALRIYNGKALINSVNGDEESMNKIFPLAKKYGACVLGLTMDHNGIPSKAEDRVKIAEKIINKASEYGIQKKYILIDCLTLTASAQQNEVYETVKAVKMVKEKLKVKTVLGVSNVSFGLPNRDLLNRTFLAFTLYAGLDAPIMNPSSNYMMDTIRAFKVLSSQDKDSFNYINKYKKNKTNDINDFKILSNFDLKQIIIDGQKEKAAEAALELLEKINGLQIVNEYIIPALDEVGENYEKGIIFLPQLIYSAKTVQNAFEAIKKKMQLAGQKSISRGKIILATVKGDVHDIGKNIVKVILENYGFEVIDLGKDTPAELILDTAVKEEVQLIGLSALMTTTVANMEKTIQLLKTNLPNCKIMVGGAVLTPSYAKMINADFYGKDAKEAADIAKNFFS